MIKKASDNKEVYEKLKEEKGVIFMTGSQLFAPSVLGLGFAETPITLDKREIEDFHKFPSATSFIRNTIIELECNYNSLFS